MAESKKQGREFLSEKDFVPLYDAAGEQVGEVPKHWDDDQLPAETTRKAPAKSSGTSSSSRSTAKKTAAKKASSSSSDSGSGDSGSGDSGSGDEGSGNS
jgi:hypothetical protein